MRRSIGVDGTALLRSQAGAFLLIAVLIGGWMVLDRLADRRGADTTDVDSVRTALGRVGLPIAAALSVTPVVALGNLFLSSIDQALHRHDLADRWSTWWTWFTDPSGVRGQRIFVAVVLVGTSIWQASRGRRGVAELCGVVGVVLLADLSTSRGAILVGIRFEPTEIDRTGLIVALALTAYWVATQSLSARRAERMVLRAIKDVRLADTRIRATVVLVGKSGATGNSSAFVVCRSSATGTTSGDEYMLGYDVTGQTYIVYSDLAGYHVLVQGTSAAVASGSSVDLRADCVGSYLTLSLNGVPVLQLFDDRLASGNVGLSTGGPGAAVYSTLTVSGTPE